MRRCPFRALGSPILLLLCWGLSAPPVGADSPWREEVGFSYTRDVGLGTSVFVVGSAEDLGRWSATNAVRLRWTAGNVWTGRVAVRAGTPLAYKYIWRSTAANRWCDPGNVTWMPGPDLSNDVPAQPAAPYTGKTVYYHSGWTNAEIVYREGSNFLAAAMMRVGPGRTAGESLYQVSGIGEAGDTLEFVINGYLSGTQYWDNAPYEGPGTNVFNYHTALDYLFLQDGNIYNYWPPAMVPAAGFQSLLVTSVNPLVQARDLHIYLPRGYASNVWKRYPVVYMHDGQNIFYRGGAFFGQWDVDLTANREISQGRMRECLIVGVSNTIHRSAEYMPPGDVYPPDPQPARGDEYMRFLCDEVKPRVDQAFRTLPDRRNCFVMGSSLGGIISVYLGYETNVFGGIGAFSPGFARATNYTDVLRTRGKQEMKIFMDHGTFEENVNGANYWTWPQVGYDIFLDHGYAVNRDLLHRVGCGYGHVNELWGRHVEQAGRFMLPATDEPNALATVLFGTRAVTVAQGEGEVAVSYPALAHHQYALERSQDLLSTVWTGVETSATEVLPWAERTLYDDSAWPGTAAYRLRVTPAP